MSFSGKQKTFSPGCECQETGCIQKKPNGKWGIISNKTGEFWDADYESEEDAKAGLAAYHANKHFSKDKPYKDSDFGKSGTPLMWYKDINQVIEERNELMKQRNLSESQKNKLNWLISVIDNYKGNKSVLNKIRNSVDVAKKLMEDISNNKGTDSQEYKVAKLNYLRVFAEYQLAKLSEVTNKNTEVKKKIKQYKDFLLKVTIRNFDPEATYFSTPVTYSLKYIKENLFNAPKDVKESFNNLVHFFSNKETKYWEDLAELNINSPKEVKEYISLNITKSKARSDKGISDSQFKKILKEISELSSIIKSKKIPYKGRLF